MRENSKILSSCRPRWLTSYVEEEMRFPSMSWKGQSYFPASEWRNVCNDEGIIGIRKAKACAEVTPYDCTIKSFNPSISFWNFSVSCQVTDLPDSIQRQWMGDGTFYLRQRHVDYKHRSWSRWTSETTLSHHRDTERYVLLRKKNN